MKTFSFIFCILSAAISVAQIDILSTRFSKIVNLRKTAGAGTQIAAVHLVFYNSSSDCSFGATDLVDVTGTNFALTDNVTFGITQIGVWNAYYGNFLSDPAPGSIKVSLESENSQLNTFSTAYAGIGSQTLCIQNVTCTAMGSTCSTADSIPVQDFSIN